MKKIVKVLKTIWDVVRTISFFMLMFFFAIAFFGKSEKEKEAGNGADNPASALEEMQMVTDTTTAENAIESRTEPETETQAETEAETETEPKTEETTEKKEFEGYTYFITLSEWETNEYSGTITYNAGTEFQVTKSGFFLPAGNYRFKNIGGDYQQINVYSSEIHAVDGWEEPADTSFGKLTKANEFGDFTVNEGYYVTISDGMFNIYTKDE